MLLQPINLLILLLYQSFLLLKLFGQGLHLYCNCSRYFLSLVLKLLDVVMIPL
jgi:hypothetical protein